MYFFYMDESGSRDPSVGTPEKPKDHIYVLLAVGLFERNWRPMDLEISGKKRALIAYLRSQGVDRFELADCEVKSNWMRNAKERAQRSPFLTALSDSERTDLVQTYFDQVVRRKSVVMAAVIDKRHLHDHMTAETLHKKAYEFLLERIEHYMAEFHDRHQALIVMDDTSKELNRAVAMKHAWFQHAGNPNVAFKHIVEYPFFARSELSNGVQLADLLAYNVYRAFKSEDLTYPYFDAMLPNFYRRTQETTLDGLKVWPEPSPLIAKARDAWQAHKRKALHAGGP